MRVSLLAAAWTIALQMLLSSSVAWAGAETLTVLGSDTVQSPSGEYRVFFQVSAPAKTSVVVRKATLRIPYLAQGAQARSVPLRVMPVTASWSLGGASWTSWQRAGGDYDDELYSDATVESSRSGTAVFDVTVAVKEWIEDGQPSYGFVITVPSPVREGVAAEDLGLLGSLGAAELVIDSMPLVGPRGGRGGRG